MPPERFLDGDEAKFFCNSGYYLIGKKKLRCVGKVWDSNEPECKGECSSSSEKKVPLRNIFVVMTSLVTT